MQHQPPDQNNPSNPLLKVAALSLSKEYVKLKPKSQVRIIATLNFKRSNDLRGRAKTKSGEDVTIMFSLALKRASLELTFVFEKPDVARDVIDVDRVAHVPTLYGRDRITDVSIARRQSANKRSLKLGARAKANVTGLDANVRGGAVLAVESKSKTARNRRVSRSASRNNVLATFGGNTVHWEINPNAALEGISKSENAWLEGEIFKSPEGKSMDACVARWRYDEMRGVPEITASVFVSMPDLIVENIQILTDDGDEISAKSMEQAKTVVFGTGYGLFAMSDAKERLVRQIIRKHLIAQGMTVEGARVQICRAFA